MKIFGELREGQPLFMSLSLFELAALVNNYLGIYICLNNYLDDQFERIFNDEDVQLLI